MALTDSNVDTTMLVQPSGYGYGYGDLIVNIGVYVPRNLSKEEKEMFEKMRESENMKPKADEKESFFKRFKKMFE